MTDLFGPVPSKPTGKVSAIQAGGPATFDLCQGSVIFFSTRILSPNRSALWIFREVLVGQVNL